MPESPYITRAAEILRAGGVAAFPTETVYGLGADAFNATAVAKVFALKGRPANNPLIVHVADETMAREVAASWPKEAQALAGAFWPGPLSLVVPRAGRVPPIVTGGGPNIAVRCPDHPVALALLRACGFPLVGPSANKSGRVSPTTAAHVVESFGDEVTVLDGGPCRAGIESTVLSLIGSPRVLRPGVVGAAEISRVLGTAVAEFSARDAGTTPMPRSNAGALESPGTLASHYAPATPAVLFRAGELPRVLEWAKGPVAVVTHEDGSVMPPHRVIRLPKHARAYAAGLYAALRAADKTGCSLIAVQEPPEAACVTDEAVWGAVRDRLMRATKRFEEVCHS